MGGMICSRNATTCRLNIRRENGVCNPYETTYLVREMLPVSLVSESSRPVSALFSQAQGSAVSQGMSSLPGCMFLEKQLKAARGSGLWMLFPCLPELVGHAAGQMGMLCYWLQRIKYLSWLCLLQHFRRYPGAWKVHLETIAVFLCLPT